VAGPRARGPAAFAPAQWRQRMIVDRYSRYTGCNDPQSWSAFVVGRAIWNWGPLARNL
jgi:hypothetical protein